MLAAAAAHLTGTALSGRPDCCAHPGSCPAAAAPQAIVVVGFPATPLLTTRMRVCISAAHSRADLDYALEVFKSVLDRCGQAVMLLSFCLLWCGCADLDYALDRWAACAMTGGCKWCIRVGSQVPACLGGQGMR